MVDSLVILALSVMALVVFIERDSREIREMEKEENDYEIKLGTLASFKELD